MLVTVQIRPSAPSFRARAFTLVGAGFVFVNVGVIELTSVVVLPIMPRVVGSDLVLKSEHWARQFGSPYSSFVKSPSLLGAFLY